MTVRSVRRDHSGLAGRALGLLYMAGAGILLLTIVLPARSGSDIGALLAIFACACLAGAALLTLAERVLEWQRHAGVALGTLLVSLSVYFGGHSTSPLALFYVWVGVYSGYFFRRRAFGLHMCWAAVSYGIVLAIHDRSADSISRWVVTIAVASFSGGLVAWLAGVVARDGGDTGRLELERLELELLAAEEPFRVSFEHAPIGMSLTTTDGIFARVNHALSDMLGRPIDELLGMPVFEVTHPEDRESDREAIRSMLAGERGVYITEKRYLRADGGVVWASLSTSLVRDAAGEPKYFVSQLRDITEHVLSSRERERALADLEEAQEIARVGSWTWEPRSEESTWSEQLFRIFEREPADGVPSLEDLLAIVHPDDRGRVSAGYAQAFGGGPGFELDYRIVLPDRRVRYLHGVTRSDPDVPGGYTGTIQDVTEMRAAELSARAAEERFRRIFDGAPIGISMMSATGVIEEANLALANMSGRMRSELHGMHLRELMHPADADEVRAMVAELAAGGADQIALELRLVPVTGPPLEIALHAAWLHGEGKRPGRILCQLQDVTERKRFEAQLQFMADHDPLTGLLNRRKFEEELRRHVAHVKRYGAEGALVVLDVDHFKSINDTLGHSVGDELIVSIAGVLARRLRESDILARLGGDEFAVLLPRADETEAAHVARSLAMAIRTSTALLSGERRHITASVGVAMFDRENQAELTAEMIEIEADLAMYDAKEAGRDGYSFYETSPQRTSRTKARLTWAARIHDALEESRFTLMAQPILDLRTGQIHQYELLIRMLDDTGDLIPPGTFLYIAERFGLIVKIDRWVIRRAIELIERRPDLQLSVNISGHSLGDAELPADVAALLHASPIDPSHLTFEVTETAAVANIAQAQSFAKQLGDLGCHFALDDFGAGFGSFYYLKHLPFDYVKIDGEFVQHAGTGHIDRLVIEAVVGIAQGLGKETVAEFVTTMKTQRMVRRLGVDYAQGNHIGPPVLAEELLRDESEFRA